jgi:type I restriction enzyme M protein
MDNASLQNFLKRLCKVIWEANVTDPLTYVTQLAYLLFLKLLDEMDVEQSGNGTASRLFLSVYLPGLDKEGEETDFSRLRWSVLTSDPDNERMLRTLRDLLPRLAFHPFLSPGGKAIFEDARIVIPDGATLRRLVDIISPVHLVSEDADVKGDLFEMLSSDLGSQKRSAQFRTPRHLIRVIVELVNPEIGKTVCDSACGTGGFLIAAYEHVLLANTSPEFVREVIGPNGLPVKRGIGDRLSPTQWEFLQRGTLHGFDGEQTFVRMTAMNALLHGFDYSPIVRRDSIGGSEDRWDEVQFDFILENPPFSGAAQSPKRSLRVEKGEKYVLFLSGALRSLRPGGRAGIVLPNGILFGDTNAHLEVKRRLLADCDLQAVVTLPKGLLEPYTPNQTCFPVFQKTDKPTENVWFYHVGGDGSSLKKARKFGPQFRNDFPDLLKKWPKRQIADGVAWRVPAKRIIENGYNLTLASLGLVAPEKTDHAEPVDILASVAEKERKILQIVEEMRELVTTEQTNGAS